MFARDAPTIQKNRQPAKLCPREIQNMTTPNRRWFRFSLRTLFVLIAIFGCWLGWQAHIVRERRELLQLVESQASDTFDPHYAIITNDDGTMSGIEGGEDESPWYWRIFGDRFGLRIRCAAKLHARTNQTIAACLP